jgi:hypothetical protein
LWHLRLDLFGILGGMFWNVGLSFSIPDIQPPH